MFTRFHRRSVQRGVWFAAVLSLGLTPAPVPAVAQSQKAYQPQMATMLAEARISMNDVSRELTVARQHLVAMRPALAITRTDMAGPVFPAFALGQAPDDSLFSAGREALNRNNFREAARLFEQLQREYPRSEFTPGAMYWEAFSRYRLGGTDNLRKARQLLQAQVDRYPSAHTHSDALALAVRIDGELARRGDQPAARDIAEELQNQGCAEGENDVRLAALNALMNSNSERALPILERVLQRRDPCSEELRETALFVVAQQGGDRTTEILMDVVSNDPSEEIRGNAVFWLSQSDDPRIVPLLDSLLRYSTDEEIRDKAIFALSQQDDELAMASMRAVAQDATLPSELRGNAIFWLGQSNASGNVPYLRELYLTLDDEELREQVLFAVSQSDDPGTGAWLVEIARDQNQPMELRKNALFWAGQSGVGVTELIAMWDEGLDQEMKEQLVFVYSQSEEPAALDKLFEIARTESDQELRENAIFWLGQSDDPRVTQFLEDLISN